MSFSFISRVTLLAAAWVLCACPSKPVDTTDGGQPDAGHHDAGTPDAGSALVTLSLRAFTFPGSGAVDDAWVAAQDGDGGWSTVTPVNGSYPFPVRNPAGRYGVAVQCRPGGTPQRRVQVVWATVSEATSLSLDCPLAQKPTQVSVSFTSEHWPTGTDHGRLSEGGGGFNFPADGQAVSSSVPAGVQDVGCFMLTSTPGVWTQGIIKRDQDLEASSSEVFDFAGTGRFVSAPFVVTSAGRTADDDLAVVEHKLLAGHGSQLPLPGVAYSPSSTLYGPPASALAATDRLMVATHFYHLMAEERFDGRFLAADAEVTLTPPPYPSSPSVTLDSSGAQALAKGAWTGGGPANPSAMILFAQAGNSYQVVATHAWLGSAQQVKMPDLSQVPGFDPGMVFTAANKASAYLYLYDTDASPSAYLNFYNQDPADFAANQHLSYAMSVVVSP